MPSLDAAAPQYYNRVILGLYWGYMGANGKENGNYYIGVIYIYISHFCVSSGEGLRGMFFRKGLWVQYRTER